MKCILKFNINWNAPVAGILDLLIKTALAADIASMRKNKLIFMHAWVSLERLHVDGLYAYYGNIS